MEEEHCIKEEPIEVGNMVLTEEFSIELDVKQEIHVAMVQDED